MAWFHLSLVFRNTVMFTRLLAAVIATTIVTATASAGHFFHHGYSTWGYAHVHAGPVVYSSYVAPTYIAPVSYVAPVYVAPRYVAPAVHVAPVTVHRPFIVPAPVHYRPFYGYRDVEVEIDWDDDGYKIEVDYD